MRFLEHLGICLTRNITEVRHLRIYHLLTLWQGPVLEGVKSLSVSGARSLKDEGWTMLAPCTPLVYWGLTEMAVSY